MAIISIMGLLVVVLAFLNTISDTPFGGPTGSSVLLVVLGGLGTTLLAYPGIGPLRALGAALKGILSGRRRLTVLVSQIVGYAETARRQGILALEPEAFTCGDQYLSSGIRLAVDGTEPGLVHSILCNELGGIESRHSQTHRLLSTFGWHCGAFGVLAAALVAAAPFAAVADVATPLMCGLLLGGLFGLTLRRRLEVLDDDEALSKRIMAEGVACIQAGDNPRIIEQKLNVLLAPDSRAGSGPPKPKPTPPAAPKEPAFRFERAPEVHAHLRAALANRDEAVAGKPTLGALTGMMDADAQAKVYELLGEDAPAPPKQVLAFEFEDIANLTDREVQMILRETDVKTVVLALLGASGEVQEKIQANVSERVGTMVKEEMASKRGATARHVVDAQLAMLHVVHLLSEKGQVKQRG